MVILAIIDRYSIVNPGRRDGYPQLQNRSGAVIPANSMHNEMCGKKDICFQEMSTLRAINGKIIAARNQPWGWK
jgi:hypothetical protein